MIQSIGFNKKVSQRFSEWKDKGSFQEIKEKSG
jgi:hypothetical protein